MHLSTSGRGCPGGGGGGRTVAGSMTSSDGDGPRLEDDVCCAFRTSWPFTLLLDRSASTGAAVEAGGAGACPAIGSSRDSAGEIGKGDCTSSGSPAVSSIASLSICAGSASATGGAGGAAAGGNGGGVDGGGGGDVSGGDGVCNPATDLLWLRDTGVLPPESMTLPPYLYLGPSNILKKLLSICARSNPVLRS